MSIVRKALTAIGFGLAVSQQATAQPPPQKSDTVVAAQATHSIIILLSALDELKSMGDSLALSPPSYAGALAHSNRALAHLAKAPGLVDTMPEFADIKVTLEYYTMILQEAVNLQMELVRTQTHLNKSDTPKLDDLANVVAIVERMYELFGKAAGKNRGPTANAQLLRELNIGPLLSQIQTASMSWKQKEFYQEDMKSEQNARGNRIWKETNAQLEKIIEALTKLNQLWISLPKSNTTLRKIAQGIITRNTTLA